MQHLFQKAQQAFQFGNFTQAEVFLRQTLQASPHHPDSLHMLGLVLSQQGKHAEAIQWILKALSRKVHPMYYNNLGLVYSKMGKWNEAIENHRLSIKLAPHFHEAKLNLATAYSNSGNFDLAIKHFKKVLGAEPGNARAIYNWGNTLVKQGKYTSALEKFNQCIQLQPAFAQAWQNKGSMHENLEHWDEADSSYQKWIELEPNNPRALIQLSNLYFKCGLYDKIEPIKKRLLASNTQIDWIHLHFKCQIPSVFQDNKDIDDYHHQLFEILEKLKHNPPPLNPNVLETFSISYPYMLHYGGRDELPLKKAFGQFYDNYFSQIRKNKYSRGQMSETKDRPHVGFVVTNNHEGVFIRCMKGILEHFDTKRFLVSLIGQAPNGVGILSSGIENKEIQFVIIPKEVDKAANILRHLDFDLLYFWEIGTDQINYFLPFMRIAPVQCTSWGWPSTSGIPEMDYYISCRLLETENAAKHYTEELYLLSRLPTYYYKPKLPKEWVSLEVFGIPERKNIYLCLQNVRKIHPDMDSVFKKILEKDEDGVLVVLGDSKEAISNGIFYRISTRLGDLSSRFYGLNRLGVDEYFSIIHYSAVILDTLYYTGGANTVADAFIMKKPYVTWKWSCHKGRYGAAAYIQAGISNAPIANDFNEYADIALSLVKNKDYCNSIQDQMESGAQEIFEDIKAVRELEQCFNQLIKKSSLRKRMGENEMASKPPSLLNLKEDFTPGNEMITNGKDISGENSPSAISEEWVEQWLQSGIEAMSKLQYTEGENLFLKVLKAFPDNISALINMLTIHELKGELLDFEKKCDRISHLIQNHSLGEMKKWLYLQPQYINEAEESEGIQRLIDGIFRLQNSNLTIPDIQTLSGHNWSSINFLLYIDDPLKEIKVGLSSIFFRSIGRNNPTKFIEKREKIHITYVVTDSHEGVFIRCMGRMIDLIDRSKFEVNILCSKEGGKKVRNGLTGEVMLTVYQNLTDAVISLYNIKSDIIHYWEVGTDTINYILPFYRLAPVQCTSWGVPATSGIPTMDYYISSRNMEPENGQDHYSEKLVILDHIPTYYEAPNLSRNAFDLSSFGLPDEHPIYLCNQRLLKVRPVFDHLVRGILELDKHGIVVFIKDKNEYINHFVMKRLENTLGSLMSRVYFVPKMDPDKYLHLVNLSTVVLDTPVYNGANTVYDAWACGVPVVSLKGKYQRERFTFASYMQMGFTDGIALDEKHYVQLATTLANNSEKRKDFIKKINGNIHKIWRVQQVVTEHMDFYKKAVENDKLKKL